MTKIVHHTGDQGHYLLNYIEECAKNEIPSRMDFAIDSVDMTVFIVPSYLVTDELAEAYLDIEGNNPQITEFVDPRSN